jgi:hypothetical protein
MSEWVFDPVVNCLRNGTQKRSLSWCEVERYNPERFKKAMAEVAEARYWYDLERNNPEEYKRKLISMGVMDEDGNWVDDMEDEDE